MDDYDIMKGQQEFVEQLKMTADDFSEVEFLQEEKAKMAALEQELYDDFNAKYVELRELMVDKISEFIDYTIEELDKTKQEDLASKIKQWRELTTPAEIMSQTFADMVAEKQYYDNLAEDNFLLPAKNDTLKEIIASFDEKLGEIKTNEVEIS